MGSLLRIALRNVLRNRRRSLITFFAVFLALAVMVAIRGFLNGLQGSFREAIIYGQTGALQIRHKGALKQVTPSLADDVPADDAFLAKVRAVPGVRAASARIMFGGMVNAHDSTAFAMLFAFDPKAETEVCPRRLEMVTRGRLLAQAGRASAILSPELASGVSLQLGERAAILTNDRDGVMNALDVDYVGAYGQAGLPTPEKKLGFVPIALAQELLRMPGRATEIAVGAVQLDDIDQVRPRLAAAVGPDYEVTTWHDVSFIDDAIAAQNFVLNFVAAIFLFIALLGVANTMLMSVFERTREIGTMMSVGVRRRQILGLFLLEAALLGLGGGAGGILAGGSLVWYWHRHGITLRFATMNAPFHLYPSITSGYVVFVLALAAGGAALAALWPSLRASRLRPVEALAAV